MSKQLIETLIHRKRIGEGENQTVYIKDIPLNLLPTDIINIIRDKGYYSENNSWDAFTAIEIYRIVEETDEQYEKRIQKEEREKEYLKKRRYEYYLKLKQEFENADQG